MDENAQRSKLIEQAKQANNILVAVSSNPSVDELSAALGLTLMLNKNDRRAVAVFSGEIPDVLSFLKPEKTFDKNADGLRDFIISLDPKKADYLRYKVVDDMVRIFITPNNTVITSKDLEFSQGDYNVDMVIAVGVSSQDQLDQALRSHGRILHDAAVFAISIGNQTSNLGTDNWHDAKAASYAQLIATLPSLIDAGEENNQDYESAMDKQVANALLTGLVATTNRFSNNKTNAEIMTLAAELMKAGANQQLIANQLASGGRKKKTGLRTDKQGPQNQVSLRLDKKQDQSSEVEADNDNASKNNNQKSQVDKSNKNSDNKSVDKTPAPKKAEKGVLNIKQQQKSSPKEEVKQADAKSEIKPVEAKTTSEEPPKTKDIDPAKLTENEKALARMASEGNKNFTDLDEYSREYIETKRNQTADDLVAKLKHQELKVDQLEPDFSPQPEVVEPVPATQPPVQSLQSEPVMAPLAPPMAPEINPLGEMVASQPAPIEQNISPVPIVAASDEKIDPNQAAQELNAQADQLTDRLQKQLEASEQKYTTPAANQPVVEVPNFAGQQAALAPEAINPPIDQFTQPVANPPAAAPTEVPMPPMPPTFDPNNPAMPPMPPTFDGLESATSQSQPNPFNQLVDQMNQPPTEQANQIDQPALAAQAGQTVQPQPKPQSVDTNPFLADSKAASEVLGGGQMSSGSIATPSIYPQPDPDSSQFVIPE